MLPIIPIVCAAAPAAGKLLAAKAVATAAIPVIGKVITSKIAGDVTVKTAEIALARAGILGVTAVAGLFVVYKGVNCIVNSDKSVVIEGNFKGNSVSMKSEK